MITNYAKKKLRNAARVALVPGTNTCELFDTVRDDDTDDMTEVLRGTTTVRHLNDLIDAAQIAKDTFMAQYQPQLDKLNKRIQNLRDIKTDVKAATGE